MALVSWPPRPPPSYYPAIEALTEKAAAISEGDLDQRAEPVGPVELVTLAEAFNTLTARLRS